MHIYKLFPLQQHRQRIAQLRENYWERRKRGPKSRYLGRNADDVFSGEQKEEYMDLGCLYG